MSDSNRPPTDYKSVALPDELKGRITTYLLPLVSINIMMKIYYDDTGCYTKFEHPYYYIEHPGWYILATTLLGIFAFNLGFLISLIW